MRQRKLWWKWQKGLWCHFRLRDSFQNSLKVLESGGRQKVLDGVGKPLLMLQPVMVKCIPQQQAQAMLWSCLCPSVCPPLFPPLRPFPLSLPYFLPFLINNQLLHFSCNFTVCLSIYYWQPLRSNTRLFIYLARVQPLSYNLRLLYRFWVESRSKLPGDSIYNLS